MWLTDLEKLADPKYGLTVKFEDGWKRRGASGGAQMKGVAGVLWHHDASPRSGTYPLRTMLRTGRAGLTGPLCHIGFDRDGTVWVVGAGKANHAGTGSVPGVVRNGGNTRLIGIEMTSAGTRPWDWTAAQLRQMPRLGAALSDIFGLSTSQHWAHYEYQDGKIDPAGLPGNMPGLRSRIGAVRFGGISGGGATVPRPSVPSSNVADPARPWTTSARIQSMTTAEVRTIQQHLIDAGYDISGWGIDGSYGDATGAAVKQLQHDLDITADGVYGPGTEKALMTLKTDIDALKKDTERLIAFGEQIHWRVDTMPQRVLDADVDLAGINAGKTSSQRTTTAWAGHNHTQTHQLLAAQAGRIDGLTKAVEQLASSQGIDPDAISAAVEAGVTASLGNLEVTVSKGD